MDSELTPLCQSVLEDFNLCLFYLPSSAGLSLASEGEEDYEGGYAFVPDLLVFQMVIICLMGVHSLKRAGDSRAPPARPSPRPSPASSLGCPPRLPHCWARDSYAERASGEGTKATACPHCAPHLRPLPQTVGHNPDQQEGQGT